MTEGRSEDGLLRDAWSALMSDADGGPPHQPRLTITGRSGNLPSHFPVEETAVACIGVALMAAATLHEQNGTAPVLNRAHASTAVLSERYFRTADQIGGMGFAPLSRFWPTSDGWVRTHANYPWHKAALLRVLETSDDPDAVASALRALPSDVVEELVFAAGGVAAAVRSLDVWGSHPQGRSLATEPLIGHQALGDARPRSHQGADLPAAGIRVLDLTRVIAGPVCTRFLGALGADVLRIDPPDHPDVRPGAMADTLLAKRSAGLDLTVQRSLTRLHDLLTAADVVVCGYRPGSLERFGLGPDVLAERHPGLVVVYLAAWGHAGPWATRRGFDSVVQAPTGIALGESKDGVTPGALPCQLLDHGTGYLAAAAALDGLRRQMAHGGTHIRRLSLARTAKWLTAEPGAGGREFEGCSDRSDPSPWLVELGRAGGPLSAVGPPGSIGDQPLRWPKPPARYLTDPPTWST